MGSGSTFVRSNSDFLAYDNISAGPGSMSEIPVTMAAWVKHTSSSVNGVVIAFGDTATDNNRIAILELDSGSYRYVLVAGGSQTNVNGGTSTEDTWQFVSSVSAAANDHKLYVNGAQVASDTTTKTFNGSPNRWSVARHAGSSSFNQLIDATIAFPVIYDRALSAAEIKEIMHKPYSIAKNLVWAPNLLTVSPAAVGNFKDLSGSGFDCNTGNIPDESFDGPPVYFG